MKCLISQKQKGVGMIEVLIAMVVIAIGLLAVAAFQTNLISGSGENKTRAQATVLAEQKMEELRNNVKVSGFNAVTGGNDTVAGANASYTRTWTITGGDHPARKNVAVQVTWGGGGTDEQVNLVTEMAWITPEKSATSAIVDSLGGGMTTPSPRQYASEDVGAASEQIDETTDTVLPHTVGFSLSSGVLPSTVSLPGGAGILTQIASGSHFYAKSIGNGIIAVYLCDETLVIESVTGNCRYIQNHFGGVVHRLAGIVYSTSNKSLADIQVAWTSSDVHACYNGAVTQSSGLKQKPYECVFAGNCDATADSVNGCYPDTAVSDAQIQARKVGPGGEYGDVGLLGLDDDGGDQEQVCFLEDTVDPSSSPLLNTSGNAVLNENYLYGVTKRSYVTRKIQRTTAGTANEQKSQGINRSYTDHHFLIITRGSGGTARSKCHDTVGTYNLALAPRQIVRVLSGSMDNTVEAEAAYTGATGTARSLLGHVTGSATALRMYIPEIGSCYLNNNLDKSAAASAYACIVASNVTSPAPFIIGGSNEHPTVTPAVFATCEKTTADYDTCPWLEAFTGTFGTATNADCLFDGAAVAHGDSVEAYPFVIQGNTCPSPVTRTCNNGTLDGDTAAIYSTCPNQTGAQCESLWIGGAPVNDGVTVSAYDAEAVEFGQTCPAAISYTCNDGVWDPTVTPQTLFQSCTVSAPCRTDVDGKAASNSDTVELQVNNVKEVDCNVASNRNYACSVLSATSATVTVVSNGVSKSLTTCEANPNVDFP